MQWIYNSQMRENQLVYEGSPLARIQINPRKKGVRVVALVSGIYYGMNTQLRLEKKKCEWVAKKKKFADRNEAQKYVNAKKEEIFRFIKAREKES